MQLDAAAAITPTPVVQVLGSIPDGPAGVRVTLKLMRQLTRDARTDPSIRGLALQLVAGLRQKDYRGEVAAIHAFVRDRIRYVRDVHNVETLQTPRKTLELAAGDCDDKAMLTAALLEAIGYATRFSAVGFRPGHFAHVFPEVKLGAAWLPLETTENWPMGKRPPGIAAQMIQG